MHSLRDVLEQSEKDRVAIGHFNVADWVLLKAVLASGRELKVPVVVGASEGEREFLGMGQLAALVRSLREKWGCRPMALAIRARRMIEISMDRMNAVAK
jgi:fructose-bisphosphate aldolase class II